MKYKIYKFNYKILGVKRMNFKDIKEKDIINIIYQEQEEEIDKILIRVEGRLKDKLEKIDLERIIENSHGATELKEVFNKLEDNYNIKITEYNKELYRQGFIDGVNLILNCCKKT